MLKGFNCFQLVLIFAAAPFLIEWLLHANFYGHMILFWACVVSYIMGFAVVWEAVYAYLDKKES